MSDLAKSLLEGLQELEKTRGRVARSCRVQRFLDEDLDEETAAVLRRLLEESNISIQTIRRQLMTAGVSIGWGTLKQHRDRLCTCWIGQVAE